MENSVNFIVFRNAMLFFSTNDEPIYSPCDEVKLSKFYLQCFRLLKV